MIQAVRGTKDVLPGEIPRWYFLENAFRELAGLFSYKEIRTPIFESTELFTRGVGEQTDAVGKEMYSFQDRGNESLSLRPELTAPIVRAAIQHSLLNESPLQRLWYQGPIFRYERPQKGRQRQFHQFGFECIGSAFPEADAEIIVISQAILNRLGVRDFRLIINSLGNQASRERYRSALVDFLYSVSEQLSPDARNRIEKNPLRVLDSKNPVDKQATAGAPSVLDYLDDESREHFEEVQALLDANDIAYTVEHRLVRGLDYYSHTVFEFVSGSLGAQDALGAGGRYNGLFEQLGGKHTPAVGVAFGVERLLLALEESSLPPEPGVDIYVVGEQRNSRVQKLCSLLRGEGYSLAGDLLRRSFKAQFREANRLGARIVMIAGEDELAADAVTLKEMATGEQRTVAAASLADEVRRLLG